MVSTQEIIAYAELCVYIPILILAIFVVFRHGFQKQLGWIYLTIFCAIRLGGAGFEIAKSHNPDSKTDIEWAAILQSVGLSPLLMASLGLLKRVTDEVSNHTRSDNSMNMGRGGLVNKILTKRATASSRRSRIIQLLQIPTMIALILCVIGGMDMTSNNPHDVSAAKKKTKIGVIIFFFVYLLLLALAIITMKDVGNAPHGEKRIYFAVLFALPLIAVRVLWSILSAFSHSSNFSILYGKPLIQLFMATLEEFLVVAAYTLVGLMAGKATYY